MKRGRSRSRSKARRRAADVQQLFDSHVQTKSSSGSMYDPPTTTTAAFHASLETTPAVAATPVTPDQQQQQQDSSRSMSLYTSTPSSRSVDENEQQYIDLGVSSSNDNSSNSSNSSNDDNDSSTDASNEARYLALLQAAERPHGPHYPAYLARQQRDAECTLNVSRDYSLPSAAPFDELEHLQLRSSNNDNHGRCSEQQQTQQSRKVRSLSRAFFDNDEPNYVNNDNYNNNNYSDDDEEPFDMLAQEQLSLDLHRRLERNSSGSNQSSPHSHNNSHDSSHKEDETETLPQTPLVDLNETTASNAILNLSPILRTQQQQVVDLTHMLALPSLHRVHAGRESLSDHDDHQQYDNQRNHSPARSNTSSLSNDATFHWHAAAEAELDVKDMNAPPAIFTKRSSKSNNTFATANTPSTQADGPSLYDGSPRCINDNDVEANINSGSKQHAPPNDASCCCNASHSRGVWIMFGIGVLLLLTAIAMAIGFVVVDGRDNNLRQNDAAAMTSSSSMNHEELEGASIDMPTASPSYLNPTALMTSFPAAAPSVAAAEELPPAPHDHAFHSSPPLLKPHQPASPEAKPLIIIEPPPENASQSPFAMMQRYASALRPYTFDNGTLMQQPGSAQHQALQWLASNPENDTSFNVEALVQKYAMATIYFGTNRNESWTNTRGWLSNESECTWWARTMNHTNDDDDILSSSVVNSCNSDGRITKLSLSGNSLQGSLPPEIGMLTSLELLDLSFNELAGTLPLQIGYLTNLEYVLLHSNKFIGDIPDSWANLTKMQLLRVDDNDLSGLLIRPAVCSSMFGDKPNLYADCGGSNPEVTCPDGACCTYCCTDTDAPQDGTGQSTTTGEGLFARGTCQCAFRNTSSEKNYC
ncbi:hypothetical protein MPSEU_001038900 [Mayamaea pseudoterrestris]|nr:hypothetical protein MPSEU_001038900 [Mayamaea pseudoterrestris]